MEIRPPPSWQDCVSAAPKLSVPNALAGHQMQCRPSPNCKALKGVFELLSASSERLFVKEPAACKPVIAHRVGVKVNLDPVPEATVVSHLVGAQEQARPVSLNVGVDGLPRVSDAAIVPTRNGEGTKESRYWSIYTKPGDCEIDHGIQVSRNSSLAQSRHLAQDVCN